MEALEKLNNQLVVLRIAFDEAVSNGKSFEEVKKIHVQIKELESQIIQRELILSKEKKDKAN